MTDPELLVAFGGAAGAITRYLIGEIIRTTAFPFATILVNVLGSFIVAIVLFGGFGADAVHLIGIGFCGALTTFSTFSVQTMSLVEDRKWMEAGIFAIGTTIVAMLGFILGWLLVR